VAARPTPAEARTSWACYSSSFCKHPLRVGRLKFLFGNPVAAWLGKISFGLCVYHELGLQLTRLLFAGELQTGGTPQQWVPFVSCALALTIAISAISYYTLKRCYLRLKQRFEFVHPRPI
jgi:peptidoglycan/LPS O-acetylase OafA/YrhL